MTLKISFFGWNFIFILYDTGLILAIKYGCIDIVRLLLTYNDIDANIKNILMKHYS